MMKLFNGFGIIGSVFQQIFMVFNQFVFQTVQRCPYFFASRLYAQYKAGFRIDALPGSYWLLDREFLWLVETAIESASIWKPSQLTRLLLNFDLLKAGQIDAELAKKFRRVQKENFSKMSKFSNFCNFLGSCNSGGIHLVAFYFKLHMFLCNKNYESSEEILHEIKNEFLDEGKGSSADQLWTWRSRRTWRVHRPIEIPSVEPW